MKLGLCVVGCGQYAQTFAQGIQAILGEIDLYFASRDRQRAEAYSQMFQGSGAFGSYQEAAADSRVEAMYLCTPHHLHQEHVAMAAGPGSTSSWKSRSPLPLRMATGSSPLPRRPESL